MKLNACKVTYFSLVVKYFLNNVFIRIAFKTHYTYMYDIIYNIKRNYIILSNVWCIEQQHFPTTEHFHIIYITVFS